MYIPLTSEDLDAVLVLVIFGSLGLFTALFCVYKQLVISHQINQQVNQQISLVSPKRTNEDGLSEQKIQL
jgi:Na+-translocating ferredoxin:NAD+ oxidoreductase RnfG subunit